MTEPAADPPMDALQGEGQLTWDQLELPFGEAAPSLGSAGRCCLDHHTLARAEYDAEQLWRAGLRLSRNLRDRDGQTGTGTL